LEQLDFERISAHISHHIVAIQYGDPPVNATIECETCGTVLYSADPATRVRTRPVEMWQFALLNGGTVEQQVLAGLEFEHEITNYATVATAKALGIPLAALSGDEDDAWAEMLEAAHEHAFYAVSLDKVTVLQFGDDVPRSDVLMRPAEVYRLWPGGGWDTAFVDIPNTTPTDQVARIACERHHAELVLRRQAVVSVSFCNLPPLGSDGPPAEGVDVDAFVTLAWMFDDHSRATVLSGVRYQLSDFQAILGQYTWPLVALQQNTAEEIEGIVEDWTSLNRIDALQAIGRWLAIMAVKKRLFTVAELSSSMTAAEIATLVLTPVAAALERVDSHARV